MSPVTVDTSELDDLVIDLGRVSATVLARLDAVAVRFGFVIEGQAKQRAPVDTGNLRNSITTQVNRSQRLVTVTVAALADYAAFVEFGTYRMAPQPYMIPAFDHVLPELLAAIAAIMEDL